MAFILSTSYNDYKSLDRYPHTPYERDDPQLALSHILGETKDQSLRWHLEGPARLAVRYEAINVLWSIIDVCHQVEPRIKLSADLVGEAVGYGCFKALAHMYNAKLEEWHNPAFDAMYLFHSEYEVFREHCTDHEAFFIKVMSKAAREGDQTQYMKAKALAPSRRYWGAHHLCLAIASGKLNMVQYLYEQGAPVNEDVVNSLVFHVKTPDHPLEYLLRQGAQSDPQLVLAYATGSSGNALAAKYAIEAGARVDEDIVADTILYSGDLAVVKIVTESRAHLITQGTFDRAAVTLVPTDVMAYLMDLGLTPSEDTVHQVARGNNKQQLLALFFERGVPTTGVVGSSPEVEQLIRSYFPTIWDVLDD